MADREREARELIAAFKRLEAPDERLADKLLATLGIPGFYEVGSALNKLAKKERDAALVIVEQHVPGLLSEYERVRKKARRDLDALFEDIPMLNEDA
jgi:predicted nucleotidyltransferase